jgi:hypothetical protein
LNLENKYKQISFFEIVKVGKDKAMPVAGREGP